MTGNGWVQPDWSAELTADNGDDGITTVTVNHAAVMRAARKVMSHRPYLVNEEIRRECGNLIFDGESADLDACAGDALLQVAVLGEVVFG